MPRPQFSGMKVPTSLHPRPPQQPRPRMLLKNHIRKFQQPAEISRINRPPPQPAKTFCQPHDDLHRIAKGFSQIEVVPFRSNSSLMNTAVLSSVKTRLEHFQLQNLGISRTDDVALTQTRFLISCLIIWNCSPSHRKTICTSKALIYDNLARLPNISV